MGNAGKSSVIRCCNPKCTISGGAIVATLGGAVDIAVDGSPRWFRREGLVYCAACKAAKWADPPDGRQARNQDALTGWTWNGPQGPPAKAAAKADKATEPDDVTLPEPEPEPVKRAPKPGKATAPVNPVNPAAKPADPPPPPATSPEPPIKAAPATSTGIDAAIDAAADAIAAAIAARFAARLAPKVAASVASAVASAIRGAAVIQ